MSTAPTVITGATGWLGSRLALALTQGLPDLPEMKSPGRVIRCLVKRDSETSFLKSLKPAIELAEGELANPDSLAKLFDAVPGCVVYHCAGVVHPAGGVRVFYAVNTEGTRNLLEAAVSGRASRFIYLSSSSPAGFTRSPEKIFDETSPSRPYMHYGRSKKLAEDLVKAAGRKGQLEVVIARAPWFYGPGQPERQTRFYRMIKSGKAPVTGSGENLRSMTYVDNLCQGLILCETRLAARGQTYWFADRNPYSMNRIVDAIKQVMARDFGWKVAPGVRRLPGMVSEIALALDKLIQALGFYQQEIHVLSELNKNIACSIAKAQKELGYDPKIEIEEGVKRSIQWLVEKGIEL